jgi:hypothetical protein
MVLLAAVGLAACTNSVTVFRGGDGGAGPIDDDGGGDPSPCGSCEDPSVCSVASCMGDTCVVEHLFGNTCSAAGFDGVCDGFGNCVAADCDVDVCETTTLAPPTAAPQCVHLPARRVWHAVRARWPGRLDVRRRRQLRRVFDAACDGMGDVFLMVDDSDAPNDNDPCTLQYCSSR